MKLLVLDFETYFDKSFSLSKMTIPRYVHDPRFHVHGVALLHPDGRAEFCTDVTAALDDLVQRYGPNLERVNIVSHHAQFDLYILNRVYGIRPAHILDTLSMARQVLGDRLSDLSLAGLAKHFGLEAKGDTKSFEGWRDLDVRQRADLEAYALSDARITMQLAIQLLAGMSLPELELPLIKHTVRMFTERSLGVDLSGLEDLCSRAQQQRDAAISKTGLSVRELAGDKVFTESLTKALANTGRLLPVKPGKNGNIPATARTDEVMQRLAHDDDPAVADLAQARLAVMSFNQLESRLDTLQETARSTGGYLPPYLKYYGAHTGRFSGGDGFNIQNLGRTGLIGEVRSLLMPNADCVFVIGDLAQIEARVLAWFAGERDLLDAYRSGRDIYSEFAGQTFGSDVHKPGKNDPPETHEQLKALRQVGKKAVLGLGYAMGHVRFMDSCKEDETIRKLFENGMLDQEKCREIVVQFREQYPGIKQFWRDLQDGFKDAMAGQNVHVGNLVFESNVDEVTVTLPSGRKLHYPSPRWQPANPSSPSYDWALEELVYGPSKGVKIYGGKLCENVVQATARDILAQAILATEKAGLPVVFHVHDEIVVECPAHERDAALAALTHALETTPNWAPERLVACKVTGVLPDPALQQFVESLELPAMRKLRAKLVERGALGKTSLPLHQHLLGYLRHLQARGTTRMHYRNTLSRCIRALWDLGVGSWKDVSTQSVKGCLQRRRNQSDKPLSTTTANHYIRALKMFALWMHQSGRSPVDSLMDCSMFKMMPEEKPRCERRALTVDEARKLLSATHASAKTSMGMRGPERALLYRLAIDTGLRANELRSLTCASFDLESSPATVRVEKGKTKNRKGAVLEMSSETTALLKEYLAGKAPSVPAFALAESTHLAETLRKDLFAAGIRYRDDQDRKIDFHALRHTRGVWLGQYTEARPAEIRELMRVSSMALVDRYTSSLRVTRSYADAGPKLGGTADGSIKHAANG